MNEEFVPFELAKKLKEKGFRWDCFAYYMPHSDELIYNIKPYKGVTLYSFNSLHKELISSDFIDAPTISQVLKWLREEKLILIGLSPMQEYDSDDDIECVPWCAGIYKGDKHGGLSWKEELYYQSYEEAAIAGIEYCLDNLI